MRRSSPPGRPNRTRSTSTARRTSTGTASPPSACSGSRSRATGCSTRCYGASRPTRPSGAFPLRRHLAQQRQQLSLKPGTDGRLTVCSHGILDPEKMQKQFFGYDITDSDKQVLRQTGNMGHPATVTNRAGEQVEALSAATSRPTSWSPSRSPRSISRRRRTGIPSPRTK